MHFSVHEGRSIVHKHSKRWPTDEAVSLKVSKLGKFVVVGPDASMAELTIVDRLPRNTENRHTILYTVRVFKEIRECSTETARDNSPGHSNGEATNNAVKQKAGTHTNT